MQGLKINSPAVVTEGETYSVRITVTNQSTRAGQPTRATLTIGWRASAGTDTLIPLLEFEQLFAPGESTTWERPMTIPYFTEPTGIIEAWVKDPEGNILASGSETLEIVAAAPEGIILGYDKPKQASTDWMARLYNTETHTWSEVYTEEKIGTLHAFPEMSNTFLAIFRETYNVFFNPYEYGPFVITVPGPGVYTWDAQSERLDGIPAVSLPKTNNLCQIVGTVTARGMVDESTSEITIAVESATDISGYVNAGQYFVGDTIKARTVENTNRLVGEKIEAKLEMVEVPLDTGEYGYTYQWWVSDIKFALGWPDWAFDFGAELRRYSFHYQDEDGFWHTAEGYEWSVWSNAGLESFACAVTVYDPTFNDTYVMFRGTGPASGSFENIPGRVTPGVPGFMSATVWAHPDPNESFDRPDYALQRGWVQVITL